MCPENYFLINNILKKLDFRITNEEFSCFERSLPLKNMKPNKKMRNKFSSEALECQLVSFRTKKKSNLFFFNLVAWLKIFSL